MIYSGTGDFPLHDKLTFFLANRRQHVATSPTDDILTHYKLRVEEHAKAYPSVAGILLFGKRVQYYFPEAMIICSHFKGTQGREAIATIDCIGTLFEQLEQSYEFILSRLSHSFTIQGLKREEKLEVPAIAIRELLLNAMIHRNYHLRAPIKIAIYDNRIEIFSPGNFPTPLPNLTLGLTDARNAVIYRIFREAKLIEKLGSGLIAAFDSYEEWGLPAPEILDGDGFVKCILPRVGYAEKIDEYQKILALYETYDTLSVSEVMQLLSIPRSTASRKLTALCNQKKLQRIGSGKKIRYSLRI